jgi:hypothetical protein
MRVEVCALFAVALCTAFGASSLGELSYPALTVNDLCARVDRQIAALGDVVMHEEISRYTSLRGKSVKSMNSTRRWRSRMVRIASRR